MPERVLQFVVLFCGNKKLYKKWDEEDNCDKKSIGKILYIKNIDTVEHKNNSNQGVQGEHQILIRSRFLI